MDAALLAKKRPVAVLTRQNWRDWFHIFKLYLAGEGLAFVIEKTLNQYAAVNVADALKNLDLNGTASQTATTALDANCRVTYDTSSAKVQYLLTICVDSLDNDLIRNYTTAYDQWAALYAKYNKTRPHENRDDLTKLTTFMLSPETRIEDG